MKTKANLIFSCINTGGGTQENHLLEFLALRRSKRHDDG